METINTPSQAIIRLSEIGNTMQFESDAGGDAVRRENRVPRYQSRSISECITNVQTPGGKKPILQTMVTTACERNCYYCPFRAGRAKTRRATYSPDALAGAFDTLVKAKKVDGLFLSSGIIKGSVTTQDKLIDTIEIVRRKYRYRGYVHLKIMPGAERDQLYRAMQLADRVSVNLEGATEQRLAALAPKKHYMSELLQMLVWADELRKENPHQRLARTVTQFVVGAVGDTDLELLSVSDRLYSQLHLARVYYSGFSPVVDTPLENTPAIAAIREHRLYQASYLLRDYGWNVEDLPFVDAGNLRTDIDPKQAFAEATLKHAPIDLQQAERHELLKVPQIGPVGADAIINARRERRITSLNQLRALGIKAPEKAAPYVLLDGKRPALQLGLFGDD
jgi:predicted DNA-binding helix-hairpin-helix protein